MLGPDGEPLARKYYSEKTERDLDADEIIGEADRQQIQKAFICCQASGRRNRAAAKACQEEGFARQECDHVGKRRGGRREGD